MTNLKNKIIMMTFASTIILSMIPSQSFAADGYVPAKEAGIDQIVYVKTTPLEAGSAHCLFTNKQGSFNVFVTPSYLDIPKASGKLDIKCKSANGQWGGHMQITAKMDGSFQSIVNLPFTGLTALNGVLNDFNEPMNNTVAGAVKYPSIIEIPMQEFNPSIRSAHLGTEEEAIANAPIQPVEQSTPPTTHKKVYKKKARKVYHTEESNS